MITRSALIVAVLLLAVACANDDGPPASPTDVATTSSVTTSPVTTSPATTSPIASGAPTTSPVGESDGLRIDPEDVAAPADVATTPAMVLAVLDGDSLELAIDGETIETRLVGVNAPERDECLGADARATLEAIVDSAGALVEVAPGEELVDQFGRSLFYLSANGVDINALLVASGSAMAIQSGHERQEHYLDLMVEAYGAGAGIWEFGVCGPPTVADGDVVIADLAFDPPGRDDENLNGEWIALHNTTTEPVELSEWVIRDESTANRYTFPSGAAIGPGDTVTVRIGCGSDDTNERFWCNDGPVWSNGGDTALLLDAAGNVVDLYSYSS